MPIVYSIGAVNLDVIADVFSSEEGTDRRGNFTISVGGTAFNVAANLALMDVNVVLITALKKDSLLSSVILEKLKDTGITVEKVYPAKGDSVFLAFRKDKNLKFAVNSTPIERVVIKSPLLTPDTKAVFIDFNNSVETIRNVVFNAYKRNVPVFTNLVSETKTPKLLRCPVNFFNTISCNVKELKCLLKCINHEGYTKNPSISTLSKKFPQPYWLITSDCDGATLWQKGQCLGAVTSPETKVINYSGAGDALIAGFLYGRVFYCLTPEEALRFATNTLSLTLKQRHTNPVGSTSGFDASILYKDRLTGLPTRAILDTVDLKDYAILVLDIDHFKKINDTYGHKAGDDVLKTFALILKKAIRQSDLAIRWGGEEFVVILHRSSFTDAVKVAERIRKEVEQTEFHVEHPVKKIHVTCSIGLSASLNGQQRSFHDVFKEADENLYKAKNSGRNRVIATLRQIQ